MRKPKHIALAAALLATVLGGGKVMNANSDANKAETRPVVRVAIGMDPADVAKQSTYPIDFRERGPFDDAAFQYGSVIATADVDLEVLAPHRLLIEDVRYWDISVDFDEVESFSADVPRLTLDEALARAKQWMVEVENAGWIPSTDRSKFLIARIGLAESVQFEDLMSLREAFLVPGERKVLGALLGQWVSAEGKQDLSISLIHKREDGGPRYENTPDPKDPLSDKTYLLRVAVMYTDDVREYRGKHRMELRQEALKQKGLNDTDAT